jgi:hypothetical protein
VNISVFSPFPFSSFFVPSRLSFISAQCLWTAIYKAPCRSSFSYLHLQTVEPLSTGCLPISPISRSRLQEVFPLHLPCYLEDHPILAAASLATPLNLDPANSCFYYRPNVFDGMKVHCPVTFMY